MNFMAYFDLTIFAPGSPSIAQLIKDFLNLDESDYAIKYVNLTWNNTPTISSSLYIVQDKKEKLKEFLEQKNKNPLPQYDIHIDFLFPIHKDVLSALTLLLKTMKTEDFSSIYGSYNFFPSGSLGDSYRSKCSTLDDIIDLLQCSPKIIASYL